MTLLTNITKSEIAILYVSGYKALRRAQHLFCDIPAMKASSD
jgi:hypothetical protein